VDADHRVGRRRRERDERDVLRAGAQVAVAADAERAVPGRQRRLRDERDPGGRRRLGGHRGGVVRAPPGDEVRDGDEDEAVLPGEGGGVVGAHHRAVVVDQLGDAGHLAHPGEAAQVDGGLGVPGPVQHAARDGPQRQHVPGPDEALGPGGGVGEHLERVGGRGRRRRCRW